MTREQTFKFRSSVFQLLGLVKNRLAVSDVYFFLLVCRRWNFFHRQKEFDHLFILIKQKDQYILPDGLYLGIDPYLAVFFQILKKTVHFIFYGEEIFHVRLEKFYFHIFFTISFFHFYFSFSIRAFVKDEIKDKGAELEPLFLFSLT
nr:MAG TPA: hypothetical protein [Caudoviricetes sp.]